MVYKSYLSRVSAGLLLGGNHTVDLLHPLLAATALKDKDLTVNKAEVPQLFLSEVHIVAKSKQLTALSLQTRQTTQMSHCVFLLWRSNVNSFVVEALSYHHRHSYLNTLVAVHVSQGEAGAKNRISSSDTL